MMSYIDHAVQEFKLAGFYDEDSLQDDVVKDVLELLTVLTSQGHSGFSAPHILACFNRLAKFEPLTPLTGEDDEWEYVGEGEDSLYQNKRDSSVFKDGDGDAYWIDANVFRNQYGMCYTNSKSVEFITFPWVKPESNYIDVVDDDDDEPTCDYVENSYNTSDTDPDPEFENDKL
jgi:hypothetical protein